MTHATPSEVKRQIEDSLSPEGLEWWNGACREVVEFFVTFGQRQSVEDAVAEVEELAAE